MPYRATEGLIKSLMRLCHLDLPVPDHTHMSRRAGEISVKIPRRPRQGPTHVVVDSTGLKIFGEGEWKVRQHGVGKRRTWRKSHLAVDESTKDIIGIDVTTTAWGDSEILPGLLDQIEGYGKECCRRNSVRYSLGLTPVREQIYRALDNA